MSEEIEQTLVSTSEQIKKVPTDRMCLEDLRDAFGDESMIAIASLINRALDDLLKDSGERPVRKIELLWLNQPHPISNPDSKIGQFLLVGTR